MQYTSIVIRKGRVRKKTKETDVLIYYHHKNTFYFSTLVEIKPGDFNVKKGWIKQDIPNYDTLSKKIKERREYVEELIEKFRLKNLRLPSGKELYSTELQTRMGSFKDGQFNLLNEFTEWIYRRTDVSEGSREVYWQTKRYLELFIGKNSSKLVLNSLFNVNLNFLEDFARFLGSRTSRSTKEHLSNSTINKQIVTVQNFLRFRRKRDKIKISDDIEDFEFVRTQGNREQLTENEIQKILSVAPKIRAQVEGGKIKEKKETTLRIVMDMVTLNVEIGLRIKDLLELKSNDIHIQPKEAYLEITAIEKTERPYKIPIIDQNVVKVLKKYKNDDGKLFPQMSIVTFNKSLRYLAELAGLTAMKDHHIYSLGRKVTIQKRKCDLLSSHSLRKTSINRNIMTYGRDIAKVISQHKSESGFKPYVDYNDYDVIRERMLSIKKISRKNSGK